ncbi:MAG: acyl-coenzyme A thioesterase PaaI-like protein [Acidimicrobiales bacterium]|jgi:acyl-coenzyme A thioesterase PaaI-like protein
MNVDPNRPWATTEPGQLVAKGHLAGDVLEAWKWKIVETAPGLLVVEAGLPEKLLNPQGQLFGGFTPTYVDFVSLYTVHSTDPDADPTSPRHWLTTINMRCDYFEPIVGPTFTIKGELVNQRGLSSLVSTKFFQGDEMAAHALTTLRSLPSVQTEPARQN